MGTKEIIKKRAQNSEQKVDPESGVTLLLFCGGFLPVRCGVTWGGGDRGFEMDGRNSAKKHSISAKQRTGTHQASDISMLPSSELGDANEQGLSN